MDIKISEQYRKDCRTKLDKFIKNKDKVTRIEKSIYNFTIKYVEETNSYMFSDSIYNDKADDILSNINPKGPNKNLLKAINNDEIDIDSIAFFPPDKLDPEKYESINKKREIENFKKNNKATTDAFTCSRCKQKKCTVEERQTRAGDEPMTTFVTCTNCGHTFKF
jgi:transcription elongation factor S-II